MLYHAACLALVFNKVMMGLPCRGTRRNKTGKQHVPDHRELLMSTGNVKLIKPDKKEYTVQEDLGYIEIKLFVFSSLNYLQNQHKFASVLLICIFC